MKIVYTLTLILILSGCTKEEKSPVDDVTSIMGAKLYNSLVSIGDGDAMKIAYTSLPAESRHSLWLAKLKSDVNSGAFSSIQIASIKELTSYITIDIFKGGEKKDIFKNFLLKEWIQKNDKIFTNDEIYNLIFNIPGRSKTTLKTSVKAEGAGCSCAIGSLWTCYIGGGQFIPCHKSGSCKVSASGCGALWDDECDGNLCANF